MSKEEVVKRLMELGVSHDPQDSYSTLLTVLKAAEKEDGTALEAGINKEEVKSPEIVSTDETVNEEVAEAVKMEKKSPFFSFNTKTPLTAKAHEMRKKLMHQPRVPVMIPLGHEEKIGATHQVTLNGYPMYILKGQMVDVPLQVAEVLNAKFKHQADVRQHPLRVSNVANIKLQEFN